MAHTLAILNNYRPFVINASEERSVKQVVKKIFNQINYNTVFKKCPVCDEAEYKQLGKLYRSGKRTKKFHECLKNPPLIILDEVDGIAQTNHETLIDKLIEELYLRKVFSFYDLHFF